MAIPADALLRITGRPSPAGGMMPRGGPQPGGPQPAYQTLDQISQLNIQPPQGGGIIPQRYQEGGVADEMTPMQQRTAYHRAVSAMMPARPIYTSSMLMRPPQNLSGYYGELQQPPPIQRERPIYTGPMLARPPSKLSGYYGELGYQEGGVVDPETGEVERNYATENAGDYYYVDPLARAYAQAYNPSERSWAMDRDIRAAMAPLPYDFYHNAATPEGEIGYEMPSQSQVTRDPETGQLTYAFQEGGVAYPSPEMNEAGLPVIKRKQAPRQQASAVAGEPSKQQAHPPQRYEFGPADFFYNAPGMRRLMEQRTAAPRMNQGGVIPKEFMQHLANGGLVREFTPDHHLMFSLGMKYALSPRQAAEGLARGQNPQSG